MLIAVSCTAAALLGILFVIFALSLCRIAALADEWADGVTVEYDPDGDGDYLGG